MKDKIVNIILSIPGVWDFFQDFIGANKFKSKIYPSVFKKPGGTLMDFGCSYGNDTPAFLDFDYYGIDVDPQAISAAKAKFAAYPNVKFFCTDIIKDGFKENFFDNILFAGTGHHLTDDEVSKILDILMANLKQGGTLHFFDIIRQPDKDNIFTKLYIVSDQGKHVRLEQTYKSNFFDPTKYNINEWKIFPSPKRVIRLPDVLYVRIIK